jgi:hypothetical protein
MRWFVRCVILVFCLVSNSYAYKLNGPWWHESKVEFRSDPNPHTDYHGAFVEAINRWQKLSGLSLRVKPGNGDPCQNADGVNSWGIDTDYCGEGWNPAWIAVCFYRWGRDNNLLEADILINGNHEWYVHDSLYGGYDITRTFVHESGHGIGLGHEENKPSVMNPYYSFDWYEPQADDIAGVVAMYGPPPLPEPSEVPWLSSILILLLNGED